MQTLQPTDISGIRQKVRGYEVPSFDENVYKKLTNSQAAIRPLSDVETDMFHANIDSFLRGEKSCLLADKTTLITLLERIEDRVAQGILDESFVDALNIKPQKEGKNKLYHHQEYLFAVQNLELS